MITKLVLASSSLRRQELLRQIGLPFTVRKGDLDETIITTCHPQEKVEQLARLKGKDVEIKHPKEIILAADTVVALGKTIFEKPANEQAAYNMLTTLSGETHHVYTGVSIRSLEKEVIFSEQTAVEFWPLTENEIEWYVATDEPFDKAGGYAIQGLASMFIKQITGDYYNVVGLPLSRVVRELRNFDYYHGQ